MNTETERNNGWDLLSKAVPVATGVAGLVAYVYVLGGLLVWARLTAARLYTDSAVDALGSKSLLASGLKVVAFELAALIVLSGCAWVLGRSKRKLRSGTLGSNEAGGLTTRAVWLIFEATLVAFVVACGLAAFSVPAIWALIAGFLWLVAGIGFGDAFQITDEGLPSWLLGGAVVVAAIFFSAAAPGISALILLAFVRNSANLEKRLLDDDNKRMIAPLAVSLVALSVIVLAFLTTPPVTFDRVVVLVKPGKTIEGGYVARSDDALFVATCEPFADDVERSKLPRLQVIPNDSVKRITLGGDRYAIDNGKRPSLLDLGLHLFSQNTIKQNLPGWRPSIRGRQQVCVDTRAF